MSGIKFSSHSKTASSTTNSKKPKFTTNTWTTSEDSNLTFTLIWLAKTLLPILKLSKASSFTV